MGGEGNGAKRGMERSGEWGEEWNGAKRAMGRRG